MKFSFGKFMAQPPCPGRKDALGRSDSPWLARQTAPALGGGKNVRRYLRETLAVERRAGEDSAARGYGTTATTTGRSGPGVGGT